MRVLLIINSNFSSHSASEHLLEAIIRQLALSGNDVHVVQMITQRDVLTLPESVEELSVTTEAVYVKPRNKTDFIARYLGSIDNYIRCKSALKRNRDCDAVFLQSTNVAGIAVWMTRKYIKQANLTLNVQDIFPYNLAYSGRINQGGFVYSILASIQRYGYMQSDHVITISEDMKDTLVSDGVPEDRVKVVYNWSYQDKCYENLDLTPVSHMFNNDYFNVVYAGNIGVMQNVAVLLETAELMKNDKTVWFHIIGNGVYKDTLIAKAREYGITNISFWPMQPPEMAPLIYSAADVNVIPLLKDIYKTALPSKTATCLACKKPIVLAVGKKSKFGCRMAKETGCMTIDSNNPKELRDSIYFYKEHRGMKIESSFYEQYCRKSKNSKAYADIITLR